MRRKRRKSEGSLDSLLDTMTNVVGILVIVLVMTRLSVSDAVQRIRRNLPDVSPELLEQTQKDHEQMQAELAEARHTLTLVDKPMEGAEIDAMAARVEALNEALAESKPRDIKALESQLAAKQKAVETMTPRAAVLRKQLDAASESLALLEQKEPAAVKVVHLPNPRAAPEDSQEEHFLIRNGRVMHVPLEGLLRQAEARLKQLQLKPDDKGQIDCTRAVELFNRGDVGNREFKLSAKVISNRLHVVVEPRDESVGESPEQLAERTSQFQRLVRTMASRKAYARFTVWADSFDAYLAARTQLDALDVPAGWLPVHPNYEFRKWMPGALPCFAPEPPNKPNPPGKDPPKPDIPPPPAPPKRIPNDDID